MNEYKIHHGNVSLHNIYIEEGQPIITEFGFDKLNI